MAYSHQRSMARMFPFWKWRRIWRWNHGLSLGLTSMTKQEFPAIHPGEFLNETLGELKISQAEFARAIGVSPMRISHVIKGTRPITAELALLIGRAFGQSPQYWLNLQTAYYLKIAEAWIGPAFPETFLFESGCISWLLQLAIICHFKLSRRNISNRFQ